MENKIIKRLLYIILGSYALAFLSTFLLSICLSIKPAGITMMLITLPWTVIFSKLRIAYFPSVFGPVAAYTSAFIGFFLNTLILYLLITSNKLYLVWGFLSGPWGKFRKF